MSPYPKKWFQSKAVWLGLLTLIVSILTFLGGEEWVKKYPQIVAGIGTVIGILTIIVRYLTTLPMKATMEVKAKNKKGPLL